MALVAIMYRVGSSKINDLQGLGRQMPLTVAAIVVGGLSLIGVPLTVGFVSKWYLVVAAIEKGWWWLAGLVLLGSLLAVIYVWRIVETAYFKAPILGQQPVKEAPMAILVPVWLLVSANVYFGIDTRFSVEIAASAAKSLFGVAQ